ncbi:unnamed protein product [Microthlaspi erraticum]|uniref:ABC transporter domain-containing protein n=1 Tax=Microthlaspi erraticum TaxID=1685480 RepID=A0A6D2HS10_9BRAS|nr:unnamed protein product [Microthlaspi erraticum]
MEICKALGLEDSVLGQFTTELEDGDLQLITIATTAMKKSHVYIFDEPSTYLTVKQKMGAAKVIRSLVKSERTD